MLLSRKNRGILHERKINCQTFASFIRYLMKSSEDPLSTLVFVIGKVDLDQLRVKRDSHSITTVQQPPFIKIEDYGSRESNMVVTGLVSAMFGAAIYYAYFLSSHKHSLQE